MATRNNIISALPFYETSPEQDFRKWYAHNEKFPLYVSQDSLIPFHLSVHQDDGGIGSLTSIEFYRVCCDDGTLITGSGDFNRSFNISFNLYGNGQSSYAAKLSNNIELTTVGDYDVLYYPGPDTQVPLGISRGMYYMKFILEDTNGNEVVRYSDVFTAVEDAFLEKLTRIDWSNEYDLEYEGGAIPYSEGFYNRLYLDTDIGMPSYPFTEEGVDRDGYFFPLKQISEKKFHFACYGPEYLCDVMRLIRMSDNILVVDRLGREYDCTSFQMDDPEWMDGGHYAEINCEFTTDTVVKVIGKAL